MSERVRGAWASRSPRERATVLAAAALLVIVAYVALVYALDASRSRMRSSLTGLRADAVRLERNAEEVERLRGQVIPQGQQGDLRTLVDASARAAGFPQAQVRSEGKGPREVTVVLASVPFASWLAWVADLQKQQVRLETCRIEPMSTVGVVSVTASFVRSAP